MQKQNLKSKLKRKRKDFSLLLLSHFYCFFVYFTFAFHFFQFYFISSAILSVYTHTYKQNTHTIPSFPLFPPNHKNKTTQRLFKP